MNNLNYAFLYDTQTGQSYYITDVKQYVKDIFATNSEWYADFHFTKWMLTDSHGKSLKYLVDEELAKIRRKKARRGIATGAKRRGGHAFRRIRTKQELTIISGAKAEGLGEFFRGKRKTIPDYYDEIWRSDLDLTSWKQYRNKQYK